MEKQSDEQPGELIKRRFIAGAVCPRCRAEDRIVIEFRRPRVTGSGPHSDLLEQQRCVACGYAAPAPVSADSNRVEPTTRLRGARPAVSAEPVRLLDPAKIVRD